MLGRGMDRRVWTGCWFGISGQGWSGGIFGVGWFGQNGLDALLATWLWNIISFLSLFKLLVRSGLASC